MKVYDHLPSLPNTPTCLTLGNFDGVHKGHQALIKQTAASPLTSTLITFSNHPASILDPKNAPKPILPLKEKLQLIEKLGIDITIALPFTKELANLTPEQFLDQIRTAFNLQHLILGYDARFGKKRSGDPTRLQAYADKHHIELTYLEATKLPDGTIVSSRLLRQALADGNHDLCHQITGRK